MIKFIDKYLNTPYFVNESQIVKIRELENATVEVSLSDGTIFYSSTKDFPISLKTNTGNSGVSNPSEVILANQEVKDVDFEEVKDDKK